jgi:hypothetical protein
VYELVVADAAWRPHELHRSGVHSFEGTEMHLKKMKIASDASQPRTAANRVTEASESAVRAHVSAAVAFLRDKLAPAGLASREPRSARYELITKVDQQRALGTYAPCIAQLRADEVVSLHLDRLVGTSVAARRLEADDLLKALIFAMLDASGELEYSEATFRDRWQGIVTFLESQTLRSIAIFPIRGLTLSAAPIRISDGIELDYLSQAEIERCNRFGVLHSIFPEGPMEGEFSGTTGIRITVSLPKVVGDDDTHASSFPNESDRGKFGNRPLQREDLVAEDVLVALRLLRHTTIRCNGYAKWIDSFWLDGGTTYSAGQVRLHADTCSLTETDVPEVLRVWELLNRSADGFAFSVRRFSQSFERADPDDRIVDLVIAGESIFVGDTESNGRGELRFRFALRAAKFVDHPTYGRRDMLDVMQRAYDARSAVVHGGHPNPKKIFLPDDKPATLRTFSDAVEHIIRLAILKAIAVPQGEPGVHSSMYWTSLFLDS